MVDFGDDDFFTAAASGNRGFDNDPFQYNNDDDNGEDDMYQQYQQSQQQQQQSQPRVRTQQRQRRASVCGTAPSSTNMSSSSTMMMKPSRTKSTDNFSSTNNSSGQQVRAGSRRQASSDNLNINNTTLNGQLESMPGNKPSRTKSGSGDRSVMSSQSSSNNNGGPSTVSRRPGTRRASLAAGASALTSRNAMPRQQQQQYSNRMEPDTNFQQDDFGYEYDDHNHHQQQQYTNNHNHNNNNYTDYEDMGYGDTHNDPYYEQNQPVQQQQQAEEPIRSRRQRRCSIADVVSSAQPVPTLASTSSSGTMDYGYGDATPDSSNVDGPAPSRGLATSTSSHRLGGSTMNGGSGIANSSISNMAIPMMIPEETKKTNRRGSIAMLGNIGRNKATKEPEVTATKKPTADRDRQRQGTLLDRVGASSGDGRGTNRSGTTSYSDRIMSK